MKKPRFVGGAGRIVLMEKELLWGFDPIFLGWLGALVILAAWNAWRGED